MHQNLLRSVCHYHFSVVAQRWLSEPSAALGSLSSSHGDSGASIADARTAGGCECADHGIGPDGGGDEDGSGTSTPRLGSRIRGAAAERRPRRPSPEASISSLLRETKTLRRRQVHGQEGRELQGLGKASSHLLQLASPRHAPSIGAR